MKTCTKCKVEKDEALFNKQKKAKDGLAWFCKDCKSLTSLKYRSENKDKISYRVKQLRCKNAEVIKKQRASHYAANREKIKAKVLLYQNANKGKIKAYKATYYAKNNTAEYRNKVKTSTKERVNKLHNSYVVSVLKSRAALKAKDIPIELIEAKRMQMMINRKLKELRE